MSKFSQLSKKIQNKEGLPKKNADAIAAAAGRAKYGKAGMEAKAKTGMAKKGC